MDISVGDKLFFFYGAMHPTDEGIVESINDGIAAVVIDENESILMTSVEINHIKPMPEDFKYTIGVWKL